MKKLLFIIIFILLSHSISYAATRTISDAGGNWSANGTWVEGSPPISTDDVVATATSGNIVIDTATCVCSTLILTNYTGQMTFTAGQQLTVTSTVTFVAGMTLTGTGTLRMGGNFTITSGGLTFPGSVELYATHTLADNWTVSGNIIINTTASVLNGNILYVGGGLTLATGCALSGTTTIVLNGTGTWSSDAITSRLSNSLTINTAGTITLGALVTYEDGTLTYTAGTVDSSTNSSIVYIQDSCTLNTNGMSFYDIVIRPGASETITLGSNLTCTNDFIIDTSNDTITTAGAYDIYCANFVMEANEIVLGTSTFNMKSGETLVVSNSMQICGSANITYQPTIKAVTAETAFNLDYNGTAANCKVFGAIFTDVDASLSAQGIDNWHGGTLTRTTNITNRTSADIGGGGGEHSFGSVN